MVPSFDDGRLTADRPELVQSRGNDLSNLEAHGQKFVWDSTSKDRRTKASAVTTPTTAYVARGARAGGRFQTHSTCGRAERLGI